MTCPRCKANALIIDQAPDAYYKRVYCTACQYAEALKYFRVNEILRNKIN